MKEPKNLLSDDPLSVLAANLEALDKYRRERSAEADFDIYLNFLEEISSFFGFTENKKRVDKFKMDREPIL